MRPILRTVSELHERRNRLGFTPGRSAEKVGGSQEHAIREASLVRRVLRGAQSGGWGASGASATLHAVESGTARELVLTRHFVDSCPAVAANVLTLAQAAGVPARVVSGVGAFELDMVAGGIGALLRRPSAAAADAQL